MKTISCSDLSKINTEVVCFILSQNNEGATLNYRPSCWILILVVFLWSHTSEILLYRWKRAERTVTIEKKYKSHFQQRILNHDTKKKLNGFLKGNTTCKAVFSEIIKSDATYIHYCTSRRFKHMTPSHKGWIWLQKWHSDTVGVSNVICLWYLCWRKWCMTFGTEQ